MMISLARWAILVMALMAALPPGGGAARAETLADALASAYRSSGLLAQNRALLRAADEDVAGAVAAMRPVLNYVLGSRYNSISDSTVSNLQLSASMVLWDFGRSRLRREAARENVLSLRAALAGVEQKALMRAVSAYAGLLREQATVELRRNNVKLLEEQLKATKERFDLGQISRTDVAFSEARLAGARSALAAARAALEGARAEYKAAIGHKPGLLAPLPAAPKTARSLEEALRIARKSHPDLVQARHSVRAAELNAELSLAAIRPTLSGSASVSIDENGNDSSNLGLTLSGPIYQGGALASANRKAAARRDAAFAGLQLASAAVEQQVSSAWNRLKAARAGLKAYDEQVRAARVALRGVREEARLGARTTLDVLDAEQEYLDANVARVSARTDAYLAAYAMLQAMGLLSAEHLGLNVPLYDPAAYYDAVRKAPLNGISPQGRQLDNLLQSLGRK